MSSRSSRTKARKRKARVRFTTKRALKSAPDQARFDHQAQDRFAALMCEEAKRSPEHARLVINWFRECAESGEPVPGSIVRFLGEAFNRYLSENTPLDQSLGLVGLKQRPRGTGAHEPSAIAAAYLVELSRGVRPTDAAESIAKRFGTSQRNVQRAVAAAKHDLSRLTDNEIRAIAVPDRH
jgi:hypothetical protein